MVEMHDPSDVELLRDYAEAGSEAAFCKLVARHTDFVFSAALRQVDSPDLASDLTQKVFTDLARKAQPVAKKMPVKGSLAGWLHRSVRYAALNHLRDTRRRHTNERQAMEQLLTNSESAQDWERIRPMLDEALESLDDEDREALLLRYFRKQDFRTVGLALGVSDDTAQKRVSRAVERLREFFAREKITIGASGLGILISTNAVQSAPIGLAATISAAAVFSGTASSTIIVATKTTAMTTLQKGLIAATFAVVAGTGIFEAHQASQLRGRNQTLEQQQAPLAEQIRQLQRERDTATNRLAGLLVENAGFKANPLETEVLKLRGEIAVLRRNSSQTNDPSVQTAKAWLAKKQKLQMAFADNPDQVIPEMQFLTDEEWLDLVKGLKLDSDNEIHSAMGFVRTSAKLNSAPMIQNALKKFLAANNGNWPNDISQLEPLLEQPMDDAILERYKILDKNETQSGWLNGMILIEKVAVNKWSEPQVSIGPTSVGQAAPPPPVRLSFPKELIPALHSFQSSSSEQIPFQTPEDYNKLAPFVTSPGQKVALENMIKALKDASAP